MVTENRTEVIFCKCGCGNLTSRYGSNRLERKYIFSHIPTWNKGLKGEEYLRHYTDGHPKGMLGKKQSEEAKKKMSIAKQNMSKETKRKMSLALIDNKRSLGYKHTKEARRNMSLSHKGEKNSLWRGGISFEPYGLAWKKQLKRSIRERDNNVCQLCNKHRVQLKEALSVHHIDYIKTNTFTFNLISLCRSCHRLTIINRNQWTQFFRNYLSEKYGYHYTSQQKLLVKEVVKW